MPRTCTICGHKKLTEINAALIGLDPLRNIATRFSTTTGSLLRHRKAHLPVSIEKAREARGLEVGEDLISRANAMLGEALEILATAKGAGQLETALKAIHQVRGMLELLGKLSGEIEKEKAPRMIEVHYIDKQIVVNGSPQNVSALDSLTGVHPEQVYRQLAQGSEHNGKL